MKCCFIVGLLFLGLIPAAAQDEAELPGQTTAREATAGQLNPAEKDAIKRALLSRAVRLRAERHRITPEAAEAYIALAKQLGAPADFVEILAEEKEEPLAGRAAYEHRQRMEEATQRYGVDALQIRLFVEGLQMEAQKIEEVIDWLPVRDLFNLSTSEQLKMRKETLPEKLGELCALYRKMLEVYNTIDSRGAADSAAQRLLSCLPELERTVPIRTLLRRVGSHRLPGYDEIVGDIAHRLSVRRMELLESSFYASARMRALDALLCF